VSNDIQRRWCDAGRSAVAFMTVAVQSYREGEVDDGELIRLFAGVSSEMSREELEFAAMWLARMGAQALISVNSGSIDQASDALRDTGRELCAIELELEGDEVA
jgi:hypothetical protein